MNKTFKVNSASVIYNDNFSIKKVYSLSSKAFDIRISFDYIKHLTSYENDLFESLEYDKGNNFSIDDICAMLENLGYKRI